MAKKKKEAEQKPKEPKKIKSKFQTVTPKTPSRVKIVSAPSTKRSLIIHRSEKPIENLYQLLAETEKTIEELSRIYTELPDSRHYGVAGIQKPTLKQETITEQLKLAQSRAERLTEIIEKLK